jgi:hypothetical protein
MLTDLPRYRRTRWSALCHGPEEAIASVVYQIGVFLSAPQDLPFASVHVWNIVLHVQVFAVMCLGHSVHVCLGDSRSVTCKVAVHPTVLQLISNPADVRLTFEISILDASKQ